MSRTRWRMRLAAMSGTLIALAAACAPDPRADTNIEADANTSAAPASTPSSAPALGSDSPSSARPLLAVDGEGLRLVDPESGATRPLPFGAPETQVLSVLGTLRGKPAQGENLECRSRYANWPDGLSLNFRDGVFLGWSLDGRAKDKLTTMSGVGPGSTRRELMAAYDAQVAPSSLGLEFNAGDMAGLLDGPGPEARITHIWAGETCIAR